MSKTKLQAVCIVLALLLVAALGDLYRLYGVLGQAQVELEQALDKLDEEETNPQPQD